MSNLSTRPRTCGFRFSRTDAAAIIVFTGGAGALRLWDSPLWWLLIFVAVHFFLFCNVFRIVRWRELVWAGWFVINAGLWFWFDRFSFHAVLFSQAPVTLAVIVTDMRSPYYHGVFARRLNPQIEDYLQRKIS